MAKQSTAKKTNGNQSVKLSTLSPKNIVAVVDAKMTPKTQFTPITEMPRNAAGAQLYNPGAIATAFMLAGSATGLDATTFNALPDHTKTFLFGRHLGSAGRNGLAFDAMLADGTPFKPGTKTLPESARVLIRNVRQIDALVNSRMPRSRPGSMSAYLAFRDTVKSGVTE